MAKKTHPRDRKQGNWGIDQNLHERSYDTILGDNTNELNSMVPQFYYMEDYLSFDYNVQRTNSAHKEIRLFPDFGGRSLETDPNSGRYWHFCGTITNVCTDKPI